MNDITNRKTEDNDGQDIEAPKIDTVEPETWLDGERERLSAGLSDEEREGIELGRRLEAGEDINLDDDDGDGDGDGDGDDDEAPAPGAEITPDPSPEPVKPEAPAPAEVQAETPPQIDMKAIRDQSDADFAAAMTRWEDGEITTEELKAENRRIRDDEDRRVMEAQDAAREQVAQAKQQEFRNAFLAEAKVYATKFPDLFSDSHIQGFDTYVRAVTSDPANDKLSNSQMLEMAHQMYAVAAQSRGITIPAPATPKPAKAARPPKPEIPPSVARIPASAPNTAGDSGRLATLQRQIIEADALTAEKIMAGMSEADLEAISRIDF